MLNGSRPEGQRGPVGLGDVAAGPCSPALGDSDEETWQLGRAPCRWEALCSAEWQSTRGQRGPVGLGDVAAGPCSLALGDSDEETWQLGRAPC